MDLIIDTSSEKLKVILYDSKKIFENDKTDLKHLKNLLPQIELVLQKANKKLEEIKTFAVVLGPGSFTGVRIGVSTIKAFSSVFNKSFIGINLFEALSHKIIKNKLNKSDFYVIINCTSTKYYFAKISKTGIIKELEVLSSDEIFSKLIKSPLDIFSYNFSKIFKIDDNIAFNQNRILNFENNIKESKIINDFDKIIKNNDKKINLENQNNLEFNTQEINLTTNDYIDFVNLKKENKEFCNSQALKPIYIALSQAEMELKKRQNEEFKI